MDRLEEIQAVVNAQTKLIRQISYNDMRWLIKQAEEKKNLEEELDYLDSKEFKRQCREWEKIQSIKKGANNMTNLKDEQVCPYCDYKVEDSQSNWDTDEEIVKCYSCEKEYTVRAVYRFEGFAIEKQCKKCNEWTDDGYYICDCFDEEEDVI